MEADEFERLPGAVFTRGFLRAYAREVRLDPEETVARFVAEHQTPVLAAADGQPADASAFQPAESAEPESFAVEEHSTDVAQMIAVVVIVAAAVAYLGLHNRPTPVSAAAPAPASAPHEVPVATSGLSPAPMPVASEAPTLKIAMEASGPCWVAATADGAPAIGRLMNAGEHEAVNAQETLTLRVGDPAAFQFSINGVAGRSLGETGRPVTVRITAQNYRDYLAR